MKTSLLLYDIPESCEFPNPSNDLRRVALRINLSCWIVDQARTPWPLLDEMTGAGVTWHLFEFAESSTESIMKVAADMLRKDLSEIAKREAKALTEADATLAEAEAANTTLTRELIAARKKHASHREATLKRTERVVNDLETAARMFGLETSSFSFDNAYSRVKGIRSLNGARAASYADMVRMAEGTRLGTAARAGEVPPEVLHDFLVDEGKDVSDAKAAFTPTTAAETSNVQTSGNGHCSRPTPPPAPINPERTFSVRDRKGNLRTANSPFTDTEAAQACRDRSDHFSHDLARTFRRRPLSATQIAWLHILACESLPKTVESPKPVVVENKPTPAPVVETARPATMDDLLPHEQPTITIREISTETMKCSSGICFGQATTLGLESFPATLNVRSHRTGNVVLFTKSDEHFVNGDLIHVEYKSAANNILRIAND